MVIRPGIELANLSDTGMQRPANEDYYCYAEPEQDDEFRKKGRLAVVADGMGGHVGGQVASGLAVDALRRAYLNGASEEPLDALVAGFREAQADIQDYVLEHPELAGMGTTCTAAALRDGLLYYGHVGDSRLYLMRGGTIQRLTQDHSRVGQMVRDGILSPEEAAVHPDRNVLTAALGMKGNVPADFSDPPIPLQAGDALLICSDGLHGLVNDDEMLAITQANPAREACRTLVNLANERGGYDNITVQILKIVT
jgi:serine/threonine protein phosphatase PrpC